MILDLNTKIENYIVSELLDDSCDYREEYKLLDESGKAYILIGYANWKIGNDKLQNLAEQEFRYYDNLHTESFLSVVAKGVFVLDADKDIQYIILESKESVSLKEAVESHLLSQKDVWSIFRDIVIGLNEISHYDKGACHFNLCPETIQVWCDSDGLKRGLLKGLDFVTSDFDCNTIDMNRVNKLFRAPETNLGLSSEKSMQYSLALLFVYMMQGFYPWEISKSANVFMTYSWIKGHSMKLELEATLRDVVSKALNASGWKRYHSIEEFISAIMPLSSFELPDTYTCFETAKPRRYQPTNNHNSSESKSDDNEELDESESMQGFSKEPKTKVQFTQQKGAGFKAVAGMECLKADLKRDFIDVVNNRDLAKLYRLKIPSMILYGPPGTGKTYISERLAEELGLDFSVVTPSDLGSIFVHGSQSMIRQLFDKAEKTAKKNKKGVLIVFDEMDVMCPQRTTEDHNNQAGEVAEFLTQLNNCAERDIFVIGTTNGIDRIDHAITRKGRIDKIVYVGLPDNAARSALFEYELNSRPHDENINLEKLASMTDGFTSSDVSYIVNECARRSFDITVKSGQKVPVAIQQGLLEAVISETRPSVTRADMRKYEEMRRQYESGESGMRPRVGFCV